MKVTNNHKILCWKPLYSIVLVKNELWNKRLGSFVRFWSEDDHLWWARSMTEDTLISGWAEIIDG